jgi:hypothetical protein
MTEMHPAATLVTLRRHASAVAWCFVVLTLVVAGERRLSEAHFNLRSWTDGLESADALDGDEIRVRLTVLNDDKPPTLFEAGHVHAFDVVSAIAPRLDRVPRGRPAPRGPPMPAPAGA